MIARPAATTALCLVLTAGPLAAVAQSKMPADLDPTSHARLPYIERKDLDEHGQKIYDMLPGRNPAGWVGGPLAFAAYNPDVAAALLDLHNAAVGKGTLSPHVRELAIMVACRETNYNLEWNGHKQSALKAGVDANVLDVVEHGEPLTGLDEHDATVIRFGRELYGAKNVDSATFAKVVELFGKRGAMDMVAVMNTYAVSGFFAIAVDEHPPAGTPALPPMHK
jgi:4-carboxymuconolactone decarboxylase